MRAKKYLQLADKALLAQCQVHAYRASGPGGQKRNKTSSAVRLHHRLTGLISKAEENRSQHANKAKALKRLRLMLATECLSSVCLDNYSPSPVLRRCLAQGRLTTRMGDECTLLVINELLTLLEASSGRVRKVANVIGVSTANLVKFFQIDTHVWRKANHIRQANQLTPLKGAR